MTKNSILAEGFVVVRAEATPDIEDTMFEDSYEGMTMAAMYESAIAASPRSQDARLAAAENLIAEIRTNHALCDYFHCKECDLLKAFDSTTAKDEAG